MSSMVTILIRDVFHGMALHHPSEMFPSETLVGDNTVGAVAQGRAVSGWRQRHQRLNRREKSEGCCMGSFYMAGAMSSRAQ